MYKSVQNLPFSKKISAQRTVQSLVSCDFSVHDGELLIYANASNEVDAEAEDDDVAELMAFFKHSQGPNDKFRRLTDRVHDLKNNKSEVNTMSQLMEDFAKEYAKEQAVSNPT